GSRSRGSAPRRPASGRVRRRKGAPMADFEGVFIPITTPFRADDVAPERLQANLRRWNATALKGYVVLGSTGEFPMLSEAERDQILIAAREAIPKERVFIAGTGTNSTLHTIRQTKRAAELGADAAIVITPHYFTKGFSQGAAQIRHYLDEAREIAARMMLADRGIPGRYGIGGLKAALDLQGLYGGRCRAPLGTPDGDAIEDIKEVLATAGLL